MKDTNILISIITVVKNDKIGFQKTINSIRKQTFTNIELVIIDGLSTDGTIEIINANKDIITQLVSERDNGLYYAMNKGIKLANGDFALFINAGDIFIDSDVLKNLINSINNLDTLYYGQTIVYFDNLFSIAPLKHHQSVLFPKSFYKKYNYNTEKYKVTAEGDYIFMASNFTQSEYLPIEMILSKIEGFRVSQFKTISGLKLMYNEIINSLKEHNGKVTFLDKFSYLTKSLAKYIGFKIGGISFVAKLLLKSYKNTPKDIVKLIALKNNSQY